MPASQNLPARGQPANYLVAYTDGGARGNPGPSGYGVVIQDQSGKKIAALSQYLGHQTNNFAEYQGLIAALEYAVSHGHKALKVVSDSELLVRQINGIYKVKNETLRDLHGRATEMIRQLDWFSIVHVLRGKNQEADALANAAMDQGMGARVPARTTSATQNQEFNGIVRNGKIELLDGELPDGTPVQIRIKK
ncbi:MAG TPA: ribonuclease HI family protein [Candidatus Methylacidiphilales bacterium]|nr:ribonuclease HI family protein [Candidatus Methylacidiphilales bacterium]